jgi:hypothetical protein
MQSGIIRQPEHAAETARIMESKHFAIGKADIHMVMLSHRFIRRNNP